MSGVGKEAWSASIGWVTTGDPEFPYRATFDETELTVRLNDFPAEPMYSLLAAGAVVLDFDDWPSNWHRQMTW